MKWPFRRHKVHDQRRVNWRDLAMTIVYCRSRQFSPAYEAYRASGLNIAARVAASVPLNASKESKIDFVERFFAREEFSIFEDISDGSQEAYP